MNKLIIDRAKWGCGRHIDEFAGLSSLLNRAGQRCCLGFLGKECGLKDEDAYARAYPLDVISLAKWPEALFDKCDSSGKVLLGEGTKGTSWQYFFAHINDNTLVDDDVREGWIKEGFKAILDIDVEFVGEFEG
jgi:hypothetical protein